MENTPLTTQQETTPSATGWTGEPLGKLVKALAAVYKSANVYGKKPEDFDAVMTIMRIALEGYTWDEVQHALRAHVRTSPNFPTPADLIRHIDGQEIPGAVYIARARIPADCRSREDWEIIRTYESQRLHLETPRTKLLAENEQLRNLVHELKREIRALKNELQKLTGQEQNTQKPFAVPKITHAERVAKTVEWMRQEGRSAQEIEEFQCVAAAENLYAATISN